jgi:pimeloyl-ACP methyl ester carboxylesterase
VLVIHGTDDRIEPFIQGEELAAATGGALGALRGSGHIPIVRDPVRVNLMLRAFLDHLGGAPP